ncbi:Uncharacterised protein [Salmonella enterica subsp. enterica]|uniref:Uncharacterized protein n=1 Tax=Salmonella enterica I TaxID=59201 RepID=A0A379W286_SALET|nr:Uncharacterised protein [Salmonella enterica subsp. enterica]
MNPPRRWPLDSRRRQAPGLDRGASLEGEHPMTRTTTSRPRMAAIYAPARYAPAAGTATATCAATARPRAGQPAPT